MGMELGFALAGLEGESGEFLESFFKIWHLKYLSGWDTILCQRGEHI